jgi:CheY-like chemotaxis protein
MLRNIASILVVDDDPPMRRLLRNTLFLHYRLVEAATALEAMASLRRDRPDIVLLELELPDIDGVDLIRKMRAQSQVPIVVLSSRGDEQDKLAALDSGAADYVSKPFGISEHSHGPAAPPAGTRQPTVLRVGRPCCRSPAQRHHAKSSRRRHPRRNPLRDRELKPPHPWCRNDDLPTTMRPMADHVLQRGAAI